MVSFEGIANFPSITKISTRIIFIYSCQFRWYFLEIFLKNQKNVENPNTFQCQCTYGIENRRCGMKYSTILFYTTKESDQNVWLAIFGRKWVEATQRLSDKLFIFSVMIMIIFNHFNLPWPRLSIMFLRIIIFCFLYLSYICSKITIQEVRGYI